MTKPLTKESKPKGRWLEEYKCGCSSVEKSRRDLTGYCEIHGADRRYVYKLPEAVEEGHTR